MTPGEIQEAYPQLTVEDIQAALAYAAEVIHQDILVPLPA
jgi:predicted nuclease of predicted toxin-antitoxin system